MDRRQVEYFLTVVESGSITAAARRLGISQPALSEAMARAEAEFGMPLLRRGARGVLLTDAGRQLVGAATRVAHAFDELDSALHPERRLERGRLTIVCPRSLALDPTTGLVSAFRLHHPRIKVTMSRLPDGESVNDVVASGRADVGIGGIEARRPEVVTSALPLQEIIAVVHPAMELSETPSVDELISHGLIVAPPGAASRTLLAERVGEPRLRAAIVVETSSMSAMIPLVKTGRCVAFIPQAMAAAAHGQGLETRTPVPGLWQNVQLVHGRVLSPSADAFVAMAGVAS